MPRGDRTGPMGQGSRTGRGAGFCNNYGTPGYFNRGAAHLPGGRRNIITGGGRGHRHWYYATGLPGWMRGGGSFPWSHWGAPVTSPSPSRSEELEILKGEASCFEETLKEIKRRISELESVTEPDEIQTGG